jgi:hypothetical protein
MTKFEYLIKEIMPDKLQKTLEDFGEDGYELVLILTKQEMPKTLMPGQNVLTKLALIFKKQCQE